jgi:hypothetical protein
MKGVMRVYPDGEMVVLFPEEPASEHGHVLAFLQTGQFMPVFADKVMQATKPAPEVGKARYTTIRKLEKHRRVKKFRRVPEIVGTKMKKSKQVKLDDEAKAARLYENVRMIR